jgi:hypothetical protein
MHRLAAAAFAALLTLPAGQALAALVRAPANTLVMVELAAPISTRAQKPGDTFAIRLAEPLVVKGQVLLRAGTPGVGEVIESSKPGMGGKGGKLVLAVKALTPDRGRPVPLKAFQLSAAGQGHAGAANALGIGGIGFAPLGVVAFAIKGGDVSFPAGTQATAKLASAQALPSLGRAPKDTPRSIVDTREAAAGQSAIALPRVPRGQGLIVFFRKKTVMGTGQWFNVREDGRAVGKLTNGVWFAQPVSPGLHTFTAKTEPEFKDSLKLKVDAGETYFVEGVLTKGVVIGIADLSPSDRAAFNAASKALKPAPAPGEDKLADQPSKSAG